MIILQFVWRKEIHLVKVDRNIIEMIIIVAKSKVRAWQTVTVQLRIKMKIKLICTERITVRAVHSSSCSVYSIEIETLHHIPYTEIHRHEQYNHMNAIKVIDIK